MVKVKRVILIIIGTAFIFNALAIAVTANFNTGVVLTFALGVLVLAWELFYDKVRERTSRGVLKWIKYALCLGIAAMLITVAFLGVYGQLDTVDYREDAVIVLGAGIRGETVTTPLQFRLDKVIAYVNQNPGAVIVVTGAQGMQEQISEALAMERYLAEKGVPRAGIIKEEKATSTYENFLYSKEILDGYFKGKPYRTAFITNDFHIFRSSVLARIAGFENITYSHAKLEWYNLPAAYSREFLAVIKLLVLRR